MRDRVPGAGAECQRAGDTAFWTNRDYQRQATTPRADLHRRSGTVSKLAQSLRNQGARKVLIAATHPVLTGNAIERLKKAQVDEVIVTNSVPIAPEKLGPPLTVLSVAPLLAEAIIRVHENRSVSELFR